ncbi:MAG: ECF-type sigma factor [Planctomycetia bacterium]|nr:ECF-type sigma factor [Planctomycetia bacterium]
MQQSVLMSRWISKLGDGNPDAMELVFRRYFEKLISLASYRMKGINRAECSGEDVALSAINSFYNTLQRGNIQLNTEDDLWGCLFCIMIRKISAQRRREFAQRRGGGKVAKISGDTAFEEEGEAIFASIAGSEPSPELAGQLTETTDELLNLFDKDSTQYKIISMKLQGFSVAEIAEELNLLPRTIFWHLDTIRKNWDYWNGIEYLIENSLEGASFAHMATFLEKTPEILDEILEKILFLWKKEASEEKCQSLRLLWHNREAFQSLLNQQDSAALELESQRGKIFKRWLSLARSEWKNELLKIWTRKKTASP